MYSRIPRQPPRPAGVPSYRQRVTPPPNYSGNAFPAEPDPDDARPRFDGLPTVSTLPARDMPPASEEPVSASAQESDADCSASTSADNIPAPSPDAPLVQEKQNQTEQQQLLLPKPVSERKMRKIRQGKAGRVRGQ